MAKRADLGVGSLFLCAKMMINAGVKTVIMKGIYPDALAERMLQEAGIALTLIDTIKPGE